MKKNLKKISVVVFITIFAMSLVACGDIGSKSPSDMDITVSKINFTVPDGFTESSANVWLSDNYPNDTSNITYGESPKNKDFDKISDSDIKKQIESLMKSTYNVTVDVTMDKMEKVTIDEFHTHRIALHYTLNNVKISQVLYLIDADKTYEYTLTNMNDNDYTEAFDKAMNAVTVEYKEN